MICIGYAGEEAFDVILYISRTLTKLDYQVLIIDLSDTKSLLKSINHGMDLDSHRDIVNYRNINYVRRIPSKEELSLFEDGVVFVAYGYNDRNQVLFPCNEIIVTLNTFPHVIDNINTLINGVEEKNCVTRILIRDVVTVDDIERVKNAVTFQFIEESMNYLYLDYADYESAVGCQVTQVIRFSGISTGLEKYITNRIRTMLPEIKLSHIKKALQAARKGR